MNNIFYVYILLDPRKPGLYVYSDLVFEYEPFYVGKGRLNRIVETIEYDKGVGIFKMNKILKIKAAGLIPISIKYKDNLEELYSLQLEQDIIKKIGRHSLNLGPLTNMTNGGDGISGYRHTEEAKKKMSIMRKGRATWNKGVSPSAESRKKMSDAKVGNPGFFTDKHHSDESKRKISDNKKGRPAWNKGISPSAESRKKMSDAHKKLSQV